MATKRSADYGNESISALKGADRVRKRPGVIFGSDSIEGCEQSFFEILSNSIDEAREGYGDKIHVRVFRDRSIEVQDYGRGIPLEWNSVEERYNWELVFCELYAGGKYNNEDAESYEYSLGLNGLGLCSTQYASEYMDVEVLRDKKRYTLHFERGEPVDELVSEDYTGRQTGTKIKWRPDTEVFTEIDIPLSYYQETLKRQSVVNPGLELLLTYETEDGTHKERFYYEHGIEDYVQEIAGDDTLTNVVSCSAERTGRDRDDKQDYRLKIGCSFLFSNRVSRLEYYHNSSYLQHGGSPEKAVRSAFVAQIDALIKNAGKYLKNESKILFADIEDCLVFVSSTFSTQTSYENQTKKSITNRFIQEAMTDFLKQELEVYFLENPDDAAKVAEQVLINKRSRENAEKTRLNLKKKLAGSIDMTNRIAKFADCRTRDVDRRELYIVEGDSALGACKLARDAEFQAIIPVRGKILNCLKADYDKIFKNEIITDIIKLLGCGVEVTTKANKELSSFDISGLRWNKVVICTDADVDGFQIRTLILTMLFRLVPTLIDEGFVYIAESPLYEITSGDKTYFCYAEDEKTRVLRALDGKKLSIQRSKGLGENEPDMMWQTTMNPDTRRLIKVTPTDKASTFEMFETLLGDNLQGRKDFIADNGHRYLELIDVS